MDAVYERWAIEIQTESDALTKMFLCVRVPRGPTRFQITYALVEISFQNTKTAFKTQNQFSKHKSSSQNTNHRSNTQNQFSNRKYNQLQISKTSFSIGYE